MASLPKTPDEVLATADAMDSEFEAAWRAKGSPAGDLPADIPAVKSIVAEHLPKLQQQLSQSRPQDIIETEHIVALDTGFSSRIIVCATHPEMQAQSLPPAPVIILFHGGGFALGFPELELDTARSLVRAHNAVVVCPSTRLAPEDPFPASVNDAWAVLRSVAADAALDGPARAFLPGHADAAGAGLIVGGTSAGANLADVVSHLARDADLLPRLTGRFLCAGGFLDPSCVPETYQSLYLSMGQNADAPGATRKMLDDFRAVLKPDPESPLWAPFDQHHPGGIAAGHKGLPPTYFQVCGLDPCRDDSLIYEKVLREDCGLLTKVDLYVGLPHCWWSTFAELDSSRKRAQDTVDGIRWLLGRAERGAVQQ